uniref:GLOBIN domain-containing protein n=1 Tax=Heterorhabditis bacteriophora TaxID=37862 RepID=A0A1I7XME6_HETBA
MPEIFDSSQTNEVFMDPEEGNFLSLSKDEAIFIQTSWVRAITTTDVGAELIIRLLNDKRSLFKSLLESQTGAMEVETFTVEIVNRDLKRAKQVGEGVVRFFQKAVDCIPLFNASNTIRKMSYDLGALHYKMRVWFQAENWLCVKNSLLEVILDLNPSKNTHARLGFISMCAGISDADLILPEKASQRMAWTKVLQFVIRNMKRGFLAVSSPATFVDTFLRI